MRTFAITTLAVAAAIGWTIGGGPWSRPSSAPVAQAPAHVAVATEDWKRPHSSSGTVVIARGLQGHFFTDGDVAGKPMNFLVDTGATTVALSREQAQAVGVDIANLAYDRRMVTASGEVRGASVTLPELSIGDIRLLEVRAVVIDAPTPIALLGQSFLDRIDKVSIEGDRMTLTKL
jgi:aspartyl protease family protein